MSTPRRSRHLVGGLVDQVHRRVAGLQVDARHVPLPELRPRLEHHPGLRAEDDVPDHELLRLGPGGLDRDLLQDRQRDRADEVLGLELRRLAELAEVDRHRRVAALDRGDRAAQADALAELRGERVGHELVPALEPEDLALEHGQAPALHDRRLPDAEQGRDLAVAAGRRAVAAAQAVEADGGVRRAVPREQLAGRDLVELVEPDPERLVLVADRVEVRPEVEERQLRPAATGDEVDLPGR